jgi:hypothetical protein
MTTNFDGEQLRQLTESIERLNGTMGASISGTGILGSAARQAAADIEESQKKAKIRMDALASTLDKLTDSAVGLGVAMANSKQQVSLKDASNVLSGGLRSAGEGLESLSQTFGRTGKVISVVFGKVLKVLGFTVDKVSDNLIKNLELFREAAKSGAVRTFDELQAGAKQTNLVMGEYVKVLGEHSAAFGQYAGSAIEGRKQFEQMVGTTGEVTDQLKMLGMTAEEIVSTQAKMFSNMGKFGMSVKDITAGASEYLMNLEALSKITGKQKSQLQKEEEDRATDARLQLKLGAPGAAITADKYTKMTAKLSPGQQKLLRDIFVHEGLPVTENIRQLMLAGGDPYAIYAAAISGNDKRVQELMNKSSAQQFSFAGSVITAGVTDTTMGKVVNQQQVSEASGLRNQRAVSVDEEAARSQAAATDANNRMRPAIEAENVLRKKQIEVEQALTNASLGLAGWIEELIGSIGSLGSVILGAAGIGAAGSLFGGSRGAGAAAGPPGGGAGGGASAGRAGLLGGAAKGLARFLPGAGLALNGASAASRFGSGDYSGAAIDAAGAAASFIPGVGGAVSLAAAGYNAYRDTKSSGTASSQMISSEMKLRQDATSPAAASASDAKKAPSTSSSNLYDLFSFGGNSGSVSNFEKLHPQLKEKLIAAAKDYKATTGRTLRFNSGFRERADQERLYEAYMRRGKTGMPVALPGTSMHERGLAVDLQQGIGDSTAIGILAKYGLRQTVRNDPVHFTISGVSDGGSSVASASASGASAPTAAANASAPQSPTSYASAALAAGGGVAGGGWGRNAPRTTAAEASASSTSTPSTSSSTTPGTEASTTTPASPTTTSSADAGPAKLLSELNTKMAEMVDLTKKLLSIQSKTLTATRNA